MYVAPRCHSIHPFKEPLLWFPTAPDVPPAITMPALLITASSLVL